MNHHPEATDRELAERVALYGDEAAFRTLYRRHAGGLTAFLRRYLGNPDVDDVVQETWLRAVRGLAGFRATSSFRTWLIGIGLNTAREALRRQSRQGHRLEANRSPPELRAASAPLDARIDLERAIADLPERHRAVLLLHDVEGFTHPEIGRLLDIATGTARSHLHHARRALRERLNPEMGNHGTT